MALSSSSSAGSSASRPRKSWRSRDIETRRCWAPSCRSRSSRRRASTVASTIRRRDARRSWSRALRSALSRSLSSASTAPAAAASTNSGRACSSASWMIAGDPVAVVLHSRPGLGCARLGKRDRMASLVDEQLPLWKPIRDRERSIAQPLGERLPHGHGGTCRAREATAADLRNQCRRRLKSTHGQHQSRYGEEQEHKSDDRTQGPRPEVCAAARGEPLNRVRHQLHEQRGRERTEDRRTQGDRKLSGQERELLSCHRGVGLQGRRSRDPRAQQLIDERSFGLEHAPNRRRTMRLQRSAEPPGRRSRPPGSPAETAACGPRRRAGAQSPALRWHGVRARS